MCLVACSTVTILCCPQYDPVPEHSHGPKRRPSTRWAAAPVPPCPPAPRSSLPPAPQPPARACLRGGACPGHFTPVGSHATWPFTPAAFTDCHVFTPTLQLEKREVAAQNVPGWQPGRGHASTASHVLGKSQSLGQGGFNEMAERRLPLHPPFCLF